MILTGECKKAFENYLVTEGIKTNEELSEINHYHAPLSIFYKSPKSMQYAVYVDFFDSVGIIITEDHGEERFDDSGKLWFESAIEDLNNTLKRHGSGRWWASGVKDTRPEIRQAAIYKANEIYNKNKQL